MAGVTTRLWVLTMVLLSVAAGSASPGSRVVSALDPCSDSVPPIAGTRVAPPVDGSLRPGPSFSLIVPPGFVAQDVQGIDSKVGQWADSAGNVISYDYGAGMNLDRLRARLVDYVECRDTIGGFPALLTAGYDTSGRLYSSRRVPHHVVIAHWREHRLGPLMTVGVASPDSASLRRGLAVLRSVRIE